MSSQFTVLHKQETLVIDEESLKQMPYPTVQAIAKSQGVRIPSRGNTRASVAKLIVQELARRGDAENGNVGDFETGLGKAAPASPAAAPQGVRRHESPPPSSRPRSIRPIHTIARTPPPPTPIAGPSSPPPASQTLRLQLNSRSITNSMLQEMLRSRQLSVSGRKADLISRLITCRDPPTEREVEDVIESRELDIILSKLSIADKRRMSRSVTPAFV